MAIQKNEKEFEEYLRYQERRWEEEITDGFDEALAEEFPVWWAFILIVLVLIVAIGLPAGIAALIALLS